MIIWLIGTFVVLMNWLYNNNNSRRLSYNQFMLVGTDDGNANSYDGGNDG
jgi:predicted membrane channel-forming protein YqfA (hemolysin III family)